MAASKRIVLGSGKLYVAEFTGATQIDTPQKIQDFCVDANLIGYIKGGASLAYTPTFYSAKDDLGYVTKTIITDEEAVLTSGVMTWNGNTLKKLSATGRVTEDTTNHLRIVKIGGIGNASNQNYIIIFHHEDDADGDIWVAIVGKNQSGFTLAFVKDQETVIDAEFKAGAQDDSGTLITYIEEDASVTV